MREHVRPALLREIARAVLEHLAVGGGSQADIHRLTILQAKVRTTAERIKPLSETESQVPSFETIIRVSCVPYDQAAW